MKLDNFYSSQQPQTPYLNLSSTVNRPSDKYKYSLHPNPRPELSQFSPYKQSQPHKQLILTQKPTIREFSPYSTATSNLSPINNIRRPLIEPIDSSFDRRPNLDFLKETDFKILQHNAMAREHIIEELTLMNHQLREEILWYKGVLEETEMRLGRECERERERSAVYEKVIDERQEDIRVILEKNGLLEKQKDEYRFKHKQHIQAQTQKLKNNDKEKVSKSPVKLQSQSPTKPKPFQSLTPFLQIQQLINRQYASNRSLSQFICCKRDVKSNIQIILKRLAKVQSFLMSLAEIRFKVDKVGEEERQGRKDGDLKKMWRWVKGIVEETVRWRRVKEYQGALARKFKTSQKGLEETIREILDT